MILTRRSSVMRKITVLEHLALDGVIQEGGGPDEDTSGGFAYGGWAAAFDDDAIGAAVKKMLDMPIDLLLGRKTFDIWAAFWPQHGDIWPNVNSATKYVASNTEGCHSEEVMVFEATYFVAVLTLGQMSPCCGQNAAQISKVLRPNNRSIGISNIFFTAVPIASSSKDAAHPPYAKPSLVSSSGPPPACMTPSRVMCSSTVIFLITEFLPVLSDFVNLALMTRL